MKFKKTKRKGDALLFKDIIPEILNRIDDKKVFTIETLKEKWPIISGDIISTHSRPWKIVHSTLIIKADHPVFANEIVMSGAVILKKIENFGIHGIKTISVQTEK